jgi:hypothetical protein
MIRVSSCAVVSTQAVPEQLDGQPDTGKDRKPALMEIAFFGVISRQR